MTDDQWTEAERQAMSGKKPAALPVLKKIPQITTAEMEVAVASWFGYRQNLVVPGVHWGLDMHECDLLVVTKSGYCTEVEIKISRADLRADAKKRHGHRSQRIKYLYFAMPEFLEQAQHFVPARAGIILVRPADNLREPRCRVLRRPTCQKNSRKMTDSERYKVARLGALRIWGLKRKLLAANQA
jgi:hypothetical protein